MTIDYKGVSFSFKNQRRKKQVKKVRLLVLIAIFLLLLVSLKVFLDSIAVGSVQSMLLEGKTAQAEVKFKNIEDDAFHQQSKKELKAMLFLFSDNLRGAAATLAEIDAAGTSVDYEKFLVHFSDFAQYQRLNVYVNYLLKRGESLPFHHALARTALFDYKGSETALAQIEVAEKEERKKELAIIGKINQQLKSGKINYIFDVNGLPMAYYDLKEKNTVSLTPGISFHKFNAEVKKSIKFYSLTIDRAVQGKLHHLFKKTHGTFLLYRLNDSSIAAAYSRPKSGEQNAVFSERYEPGSIIKILTLFSYLHSGKEELFPYNCKGTCPIDGMTFYDWFNHGEIKSNAEALAVSCNISFARMGMALGVKVLGSTLENFYFLPGNKLTPVEAENARAGDFEDMFLDTKRGVYNKLVEANYSMAKLSVGLNEISITTFHSALLSAIIAHNGSIYTPYLLKNTKNLLNLGYYNHKPRLLELIKDNTSFLKVKNAMISVVEDKRGTGRRSLVDYMRVALKTGTAGSKKRGYDAVLTGFFPTDKSEYAFAFRLEGAGKAELKGARLLKNFLNAFYNR
ncbi:MAG: hypothetical protein GY765_29355 [bacterium]|nr:hypothetical protein [bacterium]